ncbi:MAG: imidazole glycerol phosphate synthase subunit HisH [Acidobacteriota bacterium]|jgi:glutamine amidotransferase
MTVTVVDLGVGNLPNVVRAFRRLGADVQVVSQAREVAGARCLVVPGVGAAPPALRRLGESGLAGALRQAVQNGAWLLGICLGHQLLFEELTEFGVHRGLGFLSGVVSPLPAGVRVPHMGWARVELTRPGFRSLDGKWFYFVHSFAAQASPEDEAAVVEHEGLRLCAAAQRGRVVGVQFHPEKSGEAGARFLREFLERAS